MPETISGIIERVTFHNPESGFAVLRVQTVGRRGLVTVVGHLPSAAAGEHLEAAGNWVQERDHGLQFKAIELRTAPPHTPEAIEKYLGSGVVKGIGPHYARKIVEVFGSRTLAVIDDSPSFLREVRGIGQRRIQRIRDSWQEQKAVRAITVFLQAHGVGTARAVRIYKTYGERAIEVVQENPYRLASDIWGVGFRTADELANKLGIDRSSPLRAQAALRYVLQRLSKEGHCGFPENAVVGRTAELTEIDRRVVAGAVEQERVDGELVRDQPGAAAELATADDFWLYLKPLFLAEVGVARGLASLARGQHPLAAIDREAAIGWAEQKIGIEFAGTQREAVRRALGEKVLVITGGPGVGKTTIVRGIVEICTAKGLRVDLCAPTGRAAKRLAEATGREARTIHRLLEFDASVRGCKRNRENPLDTDLLIVDEVSMVDVLLMNQLVRAIPQRACLVLVGDVDQLPSVGPGTVLADVIASESVPVVRLTEIFRQAGQSLIVRAAHAVHEGRLPESAFDASGDFFFIEVNDPATITERIIALVRERIPARFGFDPLRDVQVLTPMNRSELGARQLNARLQQVLNPPRSGPQVERYGWTFRVGDKVLQTINDYDKEVFNGDIGKITAIDAVDQELTVDFDGQAVRYDFGELDELALAYALTVHKSQGSEYAAVVIPLHTQHFMMLQRNLLYTGLTRGKKLVVLVGSKRALTAAVRNADTARRYTGLARRLKEAFSGSDSSD
jgi:exodeoxyribonuclease V alpha subunit